MPISLRDVALRLWAVLLRRHSLHDNTGYSWTWKELFAGTGETTHDDSFLDPTPHDD